MCVCTCIYGNGEVLKLSVKHVPYFVTNVAPLLATRFMLVVCMAYISNVKMEGTCSSETSVDFQQTTRLYFPDDKTLHIMSCHRIKYVTKLDRFAIWS
jgi:hypothetical protein